MGINIKNKKFYTNRRKLTQTLEFWKRTVGRAKFKCICRKDLKMEKIYIYLIFFILGYIYAHITIRFTFKLIPKTKNIKGC